MTEPAPPAVFAAPPPTLIKLEKAALGQLKLTKLLPPPPLPGTYEPWPEIPPPPP